MSHTPTTANTLDKEARRVYRAIFAQDIPDIVRQRFVNAAARLNANYSSNEQQAYYRAIENVDDLEALEVAARYRRSMPLLEAKFCMMVYLAETVPETQHFYVKSHPSTVGAWWGFFSGGMRTAVKLAKGALLLRKMNDA